jgi:hypothetical protein
MNPKENKVMWWRVLILSMSLFMGCTVGGEGGGSRERFSPPPIPSGPPSAAEQELNALLQSQFPEGSPAGDGPVDSAIDTSAGSQGDQRSKQTPGGSVTVGIGYDASSTSDQVDALCVGFGSRNNAWCIPASSLNVSGDGTQGAMATTLNIPASVCDMLGSICHDIRCYEFARTSTGTFSRDNINMLAMACGNCDEPSCQDLLEECQTLPTSGTADYACNVVGSGCVEYYNIPTNPCSGSNVSSCNRSGLIGPCRLSSAGDHYFLQYYERREDLTLAEQQEIVREICVGSGGVWEGG